MPTEPNDPKTFKPSELQGDFFDHSEDQIVEAGAALDAIGRGEGDSVAALRALRRIAHSLKGRGTMFEVPSISAVAAKLEDYMAGLAAPTPKDARGIRRYFDLLDAIVETRRDMPQADLALRLERIRNR